MSIAAMVFGILGFVTCWVPFLGVGLSFIGVLLGIVAVIKKSGNKAFGVVGLVVGGLALVISAIITVLTVVAVDAGMDYLEEEGLIEQGDQDKPAEAVPFS